MFIFDEELGKENMKKLIECVPNFSEGKRPEVVAKILEQIQAVPGVCLLDKEMDANHNRSVVTFVGTPESVIEASFRAIKQAMQMIDLNHHKGEHPRMGATDVCPFIPLQDITMEECVEYAKKLAQRVGDELQIPVFLYESAATRPERKNLADVRNGEFEKLREWIGTNPDKTPDYGPNHIHPTAGAIAIGVRFWLVAYNVNLATTDLKLAKKIAKAIREKDGGLPSVKALGFELQDKQMVQVSMNLTDYRKTSMKTVFDAIQRLANEAGVQVVESEIVGMLPAEAMENVVRDTLKLSNFQPEQIMEHKLQHLQEDPLRSCENFLEAVASSEPTPGGGSVSALAGSLAAALGQMVFGITEKNKKYQVATEELRPNLIKLQELKYHLFTLVKEDSIAYQSFLAARKMKKDTPEEQTARKQALEDATMKSLLVPLDTMRNAVAVLEAMLPLACKANPNAISDIAVGCHLAMAALEGGKLNVRINLKSLADEKVKAEFIQQIQVFQETGLKLKEQILEAVEKAM